MENKCLDCKNRKVGCHSTCIHYKEFKEKVDRDNRKRRAAIAAWNDGYYR